MLKPISKILIVTVLAGIIVCLVLILAGTWKPHAKNRPDAALISLLKEAYSVVTKSYVDKPDNAKLVKSMVDGMLATLDPHSAYLPPEPYKEMEIQMSGSFGGVGIELGIKDGKLTVIAPIDDTPAFRAGIQANDHIWKIDNTLTRDMNISAAVKRMRGEKGTPVTLSILRGDATKPLTFHLIRDTIKIKSLKSRMLDQGYGLIRISQFQERTAIDFKQALQELHQSSGGTMKGLILDLRFNPGGVLGPCIELANCFIGDDISKSVIVSTRGRVPEANRTFNASVGAKEPHYPMVVLINGGTASASEIVAGALQDHKRAIIMGKTSFGKGSVQSVIPLKGNAALKLTTARYYTPSGRSIQAKGIEPDVYVESVKPTPAKGGGESTFKEKDLENRLAPEAGKEPPRKETPPQTKQVPPQPSGKEPAGTPPHPVDPDLQKDYQLSRALELLKSLNKVKEQGFEFR